MQWLWDSADRGASDLHLVAGYPPIRREHGELIPLQEEELDAIVVRDTLRAICPARKFEDFERHRNLDFALELDRQTTTVDAPNPTAIPCQFLLQRRAPGRLHTGDTGGHPRFHLDQFPPRDRQQDRLVSKWTGDFLRGHWIG